MGTSVKDGRGSAEHALNLQSNERPIALTEFVKTGRCAEATMDDADGRIERTHFLCLSACLSMQQSPLEMRL